MCYNIKQNFNGGLVMKKTNEIIQRIKSCYVADDCIQIMAPYRDGITILSQDDILFHYKKNSNYYINKYLQDERRKQFPYSNIPTHYSRVGLFDRISYANQLFEYDKPYIRIVDGSIIESYAVKDNDEALLINKVMSIFKRTGYRTRDELEKLLDKSSYPNDNIYFINLDGGIYPENEYKIASEEKITQSIKEYMQKNVDSLKENIKTQCNSSNVVGDYLNLDSCFLDFIQKKIYDFDISDIDFEIPLYDKPLLIIKTNNEEISIQCVEIFFVNHNNYKVNFYDIPVTKYTLEQLKKSTKIILTETPKISLRLNPNVTKQDLKEAKKQIELIRTDNSILGSSKLPKSCNYEFEKYSALAYDKFEKEQGPMLKKTRK